jgi:hypothetical protein
MEKLTVYKAEDGKIFKTESECHNYEIKKHMEQRIYNELRHADSEDIYQWIIDNTKGFK